MQDTNSLVENEIRFVQFEWKCKIHKPEECTARYKYLSLYQKPDQGYILMYRPKSHMRLGLLKQRVHQSFSKHDFTISPIKGHGDIKNWNLIAALNPTQGAQDVSRRRSDSRSRSRSRSKSLLREKKIEGLTEKLDKYERRMKKLEEENEQLKRRVQKQDGLRVKQYKQIDKRLDTVTGRVEIIEEEKKMTSEKLTMIQDRVKKNEQKTDKMQKELDALSKQREEHEKSKRQWEEEKRRVELALGTNQRTVIDRNNTGSSSFLIPNSSRAGAQVSKSATSESSQYLRKNERIQPVILRRIGM